MGTQILFHGTPEQCIRPECGKGKARRDFGPGFYLTGDLALAKEWAVCRPDGANGYVHRYELDPDGLRVLDFQEKGVLAWLAELMKHRNAEDTRRYRMLAGKFIEQYGVETDGWDVIKGWRADASYFSLAREFARDNVDRGILEALLAGGGFGIQYCIRTERACSRLHEVPGGLLTVEYAEFHPKYNQRDLAARRHLQDLVDSDENRVERVFSTLV